MQTESTSENREFDIDSLFEDFSKKIKANRIEVPPLPHVASEIMRLSMQEDTTFAKLESAVRMDQYLAAKIVGMANSALFARSSVQTANLRMAMSRIGLRGVRDLAMAYSLANNTFQSTSFADKLRSVWVHSLSTAILAELLAREVGEGVEYSFMAGLVHNIGTPTIVKSFESYPATASLKPDEVQKTFARLDFALHSQIGAFIAKRWSLPDPLEQILREHHKDDLPPDPTHYPVHLVRCALRLASHLSNGATDYETATPEEALQILLPYLGEAKTGAFVEDWPATKEVAEMTLTSML